MRLAHPLFFWDTRAPQQWGEVALEHVMLNGTCPDCQTGNFLEGPSGGMSTNVKCENPQCRSEFNLTVPFSIERIDRDTWSCYRARIVFKGLPTGIRAWFRRRRVKKALYKLAVQEAGHKLAR